MIIGNAVDQDENEEVFENFNCPECKIVTEMCEETKRALILHYDDSVIKKIKQKQNQIKEKSRNLNKPKVEIYIFGGFLKKWRKVNLEVGKKEFK